MVEDNKIENEEYYCSELNQELGTDDAYQIDLQWPSVSRVAAMLRSLSVTVGI